MAELIVKYVAEPGARAPEYKSEGSAGADLRAFLDAPVTIAPGQRFAVPTGIRVELPEGYEAQVRPRSGLALEHGMTCLNSPGTIDRDFRGEIKVILVNLGSEDFHIESGDRIAQLVIAPVARAGFEAAPSLGSTARGEGGFGSTGR